MASGIGPNRSARILRSLDVGCLLFSRSVPSSSKSQKREGCYLYGDKSFK